ncbi:unnamed protein product [Ranitomeya imitator]|uniref:V-type proton ATPase proteolipid subunit n=1 Tax=Ranitomeya imitator TaxID=111125 RepID=A0ABN9M5W8_9NEOB|nr:unnamed protein product [Ranitomeya imitator]
MVSAYLSVQKTLKMEWCRNEVSANVIFTALLPITELFPCGWNALLKAAGFSGHHSDVMPIVDNGSSSVKAVLGMTLTRARKAADKNPTSLLQKLKPCNLKFHKAKADRVCLCRSHDRKQGRGRHGMKMRWVSWSGTSQQTSPRMVTRHGHSVSFPIGLHYTVNSWETAADPQQNPHCVQSFTAAPPGIQVPCSGDYCKAHYNYGCGRFSKCELAVIDALGAAYGTAKSGTGIAAMSVMRPELIMKSIIPVVMAGIIAIYGLVVAVLIANSLTSAITLYKSFLQLGAGLSVGLSGLAAGFAIGIVGDAGVRGTAQQPRLFVGMILILIFAEVLGLYGLIVALILSTK